ncbi:MAG: adenylyltransferase/cytidyltransferase family protein [Candidatus Micrarchaeota archaeon]
MKTVVVAGCFDLLHLGHLKLFSEARKHGDKLVVLLARDANICKTKARKPFFNEKERKALLEALEVVDEVVPGALKDRYSKLKAIKPDVFVLGYDQDNVAAELKEFFKHNKLRVKIVRLKKGVNVAKYKSTRIREHLKIR